MEPDTSKLAKAIFTAPFTDGLGQLIEWVSAAASKVLKFFTLSLSGVIVLATAALVMLKRTNKLKNDYVSEAGTDEQKGARSL